MNKGKPLVAVTFIVATMVPMAQADDGLSPNLKFQSPQPTSTLTSGEPLLDIPIVKSRGGSLRAKVRMVAAGVSSNPILYGGEPLYSTNSSFPNATEDGGSQTYTGAFAYEMKAYGKDYAASFPPPILQLKRGENLDLDITDDLHRNIETSSGAGTLFETNFHGHGLHVSPLSMGDNIYPIINDPGSAISPREMRVRIPIPLNQESGYNWFHPHRHMQTHPQVYGGLAGILMIGDPLDPWPKYKAGGAEPLKQRFLTFSEVNIERTDEAGASIIQNGPNHLLFYKATNTLPASTTSPPSVDSWQKRVNGQLNPVITFRPGETQVFNMAAIGAFGSFNIAVTDGQLSSPWSATLLVQDGNAATNASSQGIDIKPLPIKLTADPKRMNDLVANTLLMPGNRLTMALTAPTKPGLYYLIDGWGGCNSPTTSGSCPVSPQPLYYVLATIVVEGKEVREPAPVFDVKGQDYALFNAQVDKAREFRFSVASPSANAAVFQINEATFGNGPLEQMQINSIEEWKLINRKTINGPRLDSAGKPTALVNSNTANHPFHIHQGNFIVTEVNGQKVDPNVTNPDQDSLNYISPRDTVNIPQPANPNLPTPLDASIKVKFKVTDFPGKYVFHCHILKHEDQGMMVPVLAFGPVEGLRAAFGAPLGVPATPLNVIDGSGGLIAQKQPFGPNFSGGIVSASGLGAAKYFETYAAGQASGGSEVVVFDGPKQREVARFRAFGASKDGVSIALGDVTGDGEPEVMVGSRAPGPAVVRIFNIRGRLIREYVNILDGIYPTGINVAAGDVNGDNFDDLVIGAGRGQEPLVTALSGRDIVSRLKPQWLLQFRAAADKNAGVQLAVGYVHPLTVPSYLPNVVTTAEAGSTAGVVQVWNVNSFLKDSVMAPHAAHSASSPKSTPPGPLMDTYQPFPGSNTPLFLETGYVGNPGVPQIFAWDSPSHVAQRSYSYSPPPQYLTGSDCTLIYPTTGKATSPCSPNNSNGVIPNVIYGVQAYGTAKAVDAALSF
ncbi:MAG: hypothetical protein D4R76_03025 [Methylococcus sp.]|nr:MAG: hypothetical protein D4R76_03025 [Methylococcus sp.]